MATQKKILTVQNLTEKFKGTDALLLADYRGLTMEQLSELRAAIKKMGGELEVVKNRLLGRAAKEAKVDLADEALTGPTAILWTGEDKIAAIKALHQFAKEAGLPKVKFGLFEGQAISLDRIKELANLPGIEALRAKLIGFLVTPTAGLANALSWNLKKLTLVLKAKAEGGDN